MPQPFRPPCQEGLIRAEPRAVGREIAPFRRRMVLAACILASSMAFIDGSALTVALPALRQTLGADLGALNWVLNVYVLALASLTLIGGALADAYGKGAMLALGCALFGVASAWCALAPDIGVLIAARALQGVAAAILTPSSLALIGAVYPDDQRGGAIGVWAAASAITTAGGPLLGGWLVEQFGWQAVFWINPPLALAAAALTLSFAPPAPRTHRRFDFVGAALLAGGLGALAYGLSALGQAAIGADAASTLIAAPVLLAGFLLFEARTRDPMMPLSIFRNHTFSALNAATLLVYAALALMFFLAPFHLSDVYRLAPIEVGAVFLPFTLGVGVLSRFFGAYADRRGARPLLIAGPLVAGAAFAWMALASAWGLEAGMIAPMALLGLGFAIWVAPLTASVIASLGKAQEGLASGVNNAVSRVAQLVGVAAAAALGASLSGFVAGMWLAAALAGLGAATLFFALRGDRSLAFSAGRAD